MQVFRAQGADRVALSDAGLSTGFSEGAKVPRQSTAVTHIDLSNDQRIREAAFRCFADSYSHSLAYSLTAKEWERFLQWLDASGLALYFLDRITQIGQRDALPATVVNRLQRNQEENCQRTRGLIEESIRLQQDFQSAGLSYAVMKGVSLFPMSVPRPELRHQFDLDFLMAEKDAHAARIVLERHGYTLFAISGKSWEFKKGQTPHVAAKDLYRDLPYRGVELHFETHNPGLPMRLHRAVSRKICDVVMPVLSPVDLFLGQAVHAAKDISGPFLRASHLLEFYRHVLARRDDSGFWEELHQRAGEDKRGCLAIGVVAHLITSVLGDFAPPALTSWTVDKLPPPVRLWLDLYGRAAIFQVPPGTKRYLRLREELEIASGERGLRKASILSFGMPNAVIQAAPGETLSTRIARYGLQIRFLVSRVRFHLIEGGRFLLESRRWHRLRSNLS